MNTYDTGITKKYMKIICLQENLIKGLQTVSHLAGKNINLPILNNVLIEASDGQITFTTTNLEIGINCKIRGKIERDGKCTVPAKLITDFISLLPKGNITLETKDNILKVECANDKTSINTMSHEDFPLLPTIEKQKEYIIEAVEIRNGLKKASFPVYVDTNRPEISGVFFSIIGDKLTLVGTDSYRLSEKTVHISKTSTDSSLIIPIETVSELVRILSDFQEDEIKFFVEENQILFEIGNIEIVSRLIDGNYPDYKQIIPKETNTKAEIDVYEFVSAIKRTSLFCKPGINDIKLNLVAEKSELVISSTSDQIGENITVITAKITGVDNDVVFNYKYLLDGLNNIENDNAILELIDNKSAGILKSKKDENFVYIIMPIKQ